MTSSSEYYEQLEVINQRLEQTLEGSERQELESLKQNIEDLLALTESPLGASDPLEGSSSDPYKCNDNLKSEYELFMDEMVKEGAIESTSKNEGECEPIDERLEINVAKMFKELEGKKFRAPHKHQWGQFTYHNVMVCSVPLYARSIDELQVKVLFLNPTHKEMLPCPYNFDLEKECHFGAEQCKFSHGELVPYSSLQEYIEPKFENLTTGSEVLAKQSDDLWYRGKIAQIMKDKCLVKFEPNRLLNVGYRQVIFEHILPLDQQGDSGDHTDTDSHTSGKDVNEDEKPDSLKEKRWKEKLINDSLMKTPENAPMGEWEQYTRGIGSKLMQKMGYIIGTGLGKKSSGILKPIPALVLPQGKSLDYCMKLKENTNDPLLFHADKAKKKIVKKTLKVGAKKVADQHVKLKNMDLEGFILFHLDHLKSSIGKKDTQTLRRKLKTSSLKDTNLAIFIIEERRKSLTETVQNLKADIRRLESTHLEPKSLYTKLAKADTQLNRLNIFALQVQNELDRRKSDKEMSVF